MGVGQMLVAVLAGAALFTGGKYLAGLTGQVLADAGLVRTENTAAHRNPADDGAGAESHPVLVAALAAGGLALVAMTVWLTPKLAPTVIGTNTVAAAGAIAALLVWGVGANLGWWKGLEGLYAWATAASEKTAAVAGVVAVLMFSAGGLGLGWFTPATVPQAHAQCPPDCGGGSNGSNSYGPDASQFQPPQMPNQMPDYQGGNYGSNQAPLDQNSGISIYNTQAPSVSQSTSGQSAQQSLQGSQTPQHGSQIPDYQSATPYTQGPGAPNPDYNGGQANPGTNTGSQGGQANQGAPQQQTPQQPPANQDQGQQPPQQSDQQKIDDLTKQLQDQQQQSTQDRQRIDDMTKQLQQQQGQQKQNGNQKLPKAPSKDKKKDDQQDRDKQSGDNDLTALLLGAASTRRRKQGEQDQPEQGQQQAQGPDTQALTQDGAQMGQSLPGDITNTVSDGVNLGQSAGSAAQNFGSAAQAGASIASSAQSGAVNPMDAVALVQGISGGISNTADAVNSGASIASTWLNEAGQGAQLAADANPQLKPQAQQVEQLTKTAGQVSDLTGQVASGVSQASGLVNTATSLGASGMPDTSGASDLAGTATNVSSDVPQAQSVELQSQDLSQGVNPVPPPAPSMSGAQSGLQQADASPAPAAQQVPATAQGLPQTVNNPGGQGVTPRLINPGSDANNPAQPLQADPTALNRVGITQQQARTDEKGQPVPHQKSLNDSFEKNAPNKGDSFDLGTYLDGYVYTGDYLNKGDGLWRIPVDPNDPSKALGPAQKVFTLPAKNGDGTPRASNARLLPTGKAELPGQNLLFASMIPSPGSSTFVSPFTVAYNPADPANPTIINGVSQLSGTATPDGRALMVGNKSPSETAPLYGWLTPKVGSEGWLNQANWTPLGGGNPINGGGGRENQVFSIPDHGYGLLAASPGEINLKLFTSPGDIVNSDYVQLINGGNPTTPMMANDPWLGQAANVLPFPYGPEFISATPGQDGNVMLNFTASQWPQLSGSDPLVSYAYRTILYQLPLTPK